VLLDQIKIRLAQPSFTETVAWTELGNNHICKLIFYLHKGYT
jgi:hypothetical protein